MMLNDGIARIHGAFVCRFCGRAWRDDRELNEANRQYLNEHAEGHYPMTRRPASEIPGLPHDPDS